MGGEEVDTAEGGIEGKERHVHLKRGRSWKNWSWMSFGQANYWVYWRRRANILR